ncbi:MAG: prenyltransferase/squalene oxidase repeat-containing protein [Thermoplasmata archaeon]|jgi:hypothetical protein
MNASADVMDWLLADGDPSVRYRAMRDLLDRPEDDPEVVASRHAIGQKGWAADLLLQQLPDGQWASPGTTGEELYRPKYAAANWCLLALAELGATRSDPRVAKGAELLLARAVDWDGDSLGGSSSEVCFTGNCVRMMTLFGYGEDPRVLRAVDWLVSVQKADGGWHCFPSATGTFDGWEALAALASIPPARRSSAVRSSIDRGVEFFLERGLLQEDAELYGPWRRLHYPVHYYYDALVGLEVVTSLGLGRDARLAPALDWLEEKRRPDGRWELDRLHPDVEGDEEYLTKGVRTPYFSLGFEYPGLPSRWVTLRALTVLRRAGRA